MIFPRPRALPLGNRGSGPTHNYQYGKSKTRTPPIPTNTPELDILRSLRRLSETRRELDKLERTLVTRGRALKITWQQMATATGAVSSSTLRSKHPMLIPPRKYPK
jgi:hypothetical protein